MPAAAAKVAAASVRSGAPDDAHRSTARDTSPIAPASAIAAAATDIAARTADAAARVDDVAARTTAAVLPLPQTAEQWPAFVAQLPLTGMAAQLAAQTEWRGVAGNTLTLALPAAHKHLADKTYADKLKSALDKTCGRRLLLAFEVGAAAEGSLASQQQRERSEAKARNEAAFRGEPFVQDVLARFDATIKPDSIKRVP